MPTLLVVARLALELKFCHPAYYIRAIVFGRRCRNNDRAASCGSNDDVGGRTLMRAMQHLLAVVALTAVPLSSSLGASSSSGAPANPAPVAHATHKGGVQTGPGAAAASKGPASLSLPNGRPAIGGGKTIAKPPVMRGPLNRAPSNGAIVKDPSAAPQGFAPNPTGTGHLTIAPHSTAASSGPVSLQTRSRPAAPAVTPGMGGMRKTTAQINGTAMVARGTTTAKINPSPKAGGSINGTEIGRRN